MNPFSNSVYIATFKAFINEVSLINVWQSYWKFCWNIFWPPNGTRNCVISTKGAVFLGAVSKTEWYLFVGMARPVLSAFPLRYGITNRYLGSKIPLVDIKWNENPAVIHVTLKF